MTKIALQALFFLVSVHSIINLECPVDELDPVWNAFKVKFNKTYPSSEAENKAKGIFEKKLANNLLHNLENGSYYMKDINQFSDMSSDGMKTYLTPLLPSSGDKVSVRDDAPSDSPIPDSVNYVTKGFVTSVKNQGSCGSCTMFAVVGAIEGRMGFQFGKDKVVDLSEQQIVDCSGPDIGHCQNGNNEKDYDSVIAQGGLDKEDCYPYVGQDQSCNFQKDCVAVQIDSYVRVTPWGDPTATATALATQGPQAIGIYVNDNLVAYKSGVFQDSTCNQGINHAMVLLGYGDDNGTPYWLLKNSWGDGWGENGYLRILRNADNQCSVCTDVSYPILKPLPS